MDKTEIVSSLLRDCPKFHYADEEGVRQSALLGYKIPVGDFSMAVSPGILRWIANRIGEDTVTVETGAGYTTVVFAALSKHHYCYTFLQPEVDKIRAYLTKIGISNDKVTFVVGSTDETLSGLDVETKIDFAYIDGCHGYPFPALDWNYIDKCMKIGGIVGMDNAELRPVREHCEFLEENGQYRLIHTIIEWGVIVRFYEKLEDHNQKREWIYQDYSRAKKDPADMHFRTRIKRRASRWIKARLF